MSGERTATHGTLSLSSPWVRHEFPDQAERNAIQARIPAGYTIRVLAKSNRAGFAVSVMAHGDTMSGNRVIAEREYYRDVRQGIDAAIDWIASHEAVPA